MECPKDMKFAVYNLEIMHLNPYGELGVCSTSRWYLNQKISLIGLALLWHAKKYLYD